MSEVLETERLIIRSFVAEDLDDLFLLDSDADVHRILGNKPIKRKEEALGTLNRFMLENRTSDFGRKAIIEKETGSFVGWAGMSWKEEDIGGYSKYFDLGYRIKKEYWNQGIATEASKAILSYALKKDIEEVVAITTIENTASQNVIEKLGFLIQDEIVHANLIHRRYIIKLLN